MQEYNSFGIDFEEAAFVNGRNPTVATPANRSIREQPRQEY